MKILLAAISPHRGGPSGPAGELLQLYIKRASRYSPCSFAHFPSEAKLLEFVVNASGRTRPVLLIADSSGEQLDSGQIATVVGALQDSGIQQLVFSIGPADGWSRVIRERADRIIAFGRLTLPHELAAVVAAEQIYRALTIRAGHPYHCEH
jgi:23S rRNA (pseudouridine1915-N3)-methyltransferase